MVSLFARLSLITAFMAVFAVAVSAMVISHSRNPYPARPAGNGLVESPSTPGAATPNRPQTP